MYESEPICGGHTLTDTTSPYPVDIGFQVGTFPLCMLSASAVRRLTQSNIRATEDPMADPKLSQTPSALKMYIATFSQLLLRQIASQSSLYTTYCLVHL